MSKPDSEAGIKLRFYWQNLICVDYDNELYDALYTQWMKSGSRGQAVTSIDSTVTASLEPSSTENEISIFKIEENAGQDSADLFADDR